MKGSNHDSSDSVSDRLPDFVDYTFFSSASQRDRPSNCRELSIHRRCRYDRWNKEEARCLSCLRKDPRQSTSSSMTGTPICYTSITGARNKQRRAAIMHSPSDFLTSHQHMRRSKQRIKIRSKIISRSFGTY